MKKKKLLLDEWILQSILLSVRNALLRLKDSPSVSVESALYGFLMSALSSVNFALRHTDELKKDVL